MQHSVDRIEWLDTDSLAPNNWNPNHVFRQELRLLERSILEHGWLIPIVVAKGGLIIDGYHRWRLAHESRALRAAYGHRVPCSVVNIPDRDAKLITVRMNRARGTHEAVRMAELVQSLVVEHGMGEAEVAQGIGATKGEVQLLLANGILKALNVKDAPYSRAWVPKEVRE